MMKKSVWRRSFTEHSVPKYPCPRCGDGKISLDGKIVERQPEWSRRHQADPDSDIMDHVERFHCWMVCDNPGCREASSVVGVSGPEPEYDPEEGNSYVNTFNVRAIYPAPIMIEIPEKMPHKARQELKQSFQTGWSDPNSAANRLRVSVEFLLDDIGIPREGVGKKGKTISYDLNGRIGLLESGPEAHAGHASTFHALRTVGNLGSHGSDVMWDNFLDALLVYEKALSDLLGNEGKLFEEAKERLLALRKPKKK